MFEQLPQSQKQAGTQPSSQLTIEPGFADYGQQSQRIFRQVLGAMSEPGIIETVAETQTLGAVDAASFSLCQSLLDQSTPLWLAPELSQAQVRHNLHFHTGVPICEAPEQAAFALGFGGEFSDIAGLLQRFPRGSGEYPETGCTLIMQIAEIDGDKAPNFCLQGPGIEGQRRLHLKGVEGAVKDYLLQRPDLFPLGLDLILVCGQRFVCIPRTTQVTAIQITTMQTTGG